MVLGDQQTGQIWSWKRRENAKMDKLLRAPAPVMCLAACPGQEHVVCLALWLLLDCCRDAIAHSSCMLACSIDAYVHCLASAPWLSCAQSKP